MRKAATGEGGGEEKKKRKEKKAQTKHMFLI
jgi:hypothetical protein